MCTVNIDMTVYHNYIITEKANLDLTSLKTSCYKLHDLIKTNFKDNQKEYLGTSTLTTQLYSSYNLLMYPYDQFYELYSFIKKVFRENCTDEKKYYIQCWLNYYEKNQYIDWHRHWKPKYKTWHGFFCVSCEPSKTTYKLPHVYSPVDITSEDNLLVISQSAGDEHRTYPWPYDDPRITIAFDIVPQEYINPEKWMNHWVPI
jgi:hypothetical protein